MNRKAKCSWLADNLGVSERIIQRDIDELKRLGYISSEHSKIKGQRQNVMIPESWTKLSGIITQKVPSLLFKRCVGMCVSFCLG